MEGRRFYETEYAQPGLTTDIPNDIRLKQLIESNFAGSEKDFSRVIRILQILGLGAGTRILDFGANWGYGVYQMQRAGYQAEGYEIAHSRAAFADKLEVIVRTESKQLGTNYDALYSSHVLEHSPNPLKMLLEQLQLVKLGGYVVAHTPNGGRAFARNRFVDFHDIWGEAHPFLLSQEFISRSFNTYFHYVGGAIDTQPLVVWAMGPKECSAHDLDEPELLIVLRNTHTPCG